MSCTRLPILTLAVLSMAVLAFCGHAVLAVAQDPFGDDDSPTDKPPANPFGDAPSDPFGDDDANPFGDDDANPFGDANRLSDEPKAKPKRKPKRRLDIFVGDPTEDDIALRSGEAAIRKVLQRKVVFRVGEDELLSKVITRLRREHKIPIVFDWNEMAQVLGIVPEETPVAACDYPGISLGSALELMLEQLEMTWVIDKDVLLITTKEREEEVFLTTKVYDMAGLADRDSPVELIERTIRPERWEDVGGPGTVAYYSYQIGEALVVRQTARIHEEIATLLADIRAVARKTPTGNGDSIRPPLISPAKPRPIGGRGDKSVPVNRETADVEPAEMLRSGEKAVRRALRRKTTIRCKEATIDELVAALRQEYRIGIVIDRLELGDMTCCVTGEPTRVSCDYANIPRRSALGLMLDELELTWVIDREVLLITTPRKAEHMLSTKICDVADLVRYRDEQGRPLVDTVPLMELITRTVSPRTWEEAGGPGSLACHRCQNAETLVVRQTARVHEEIAKLLADLRAVAGKNPTRTGDSMPFLLISWPNPWARPMVETGMGEGGGMGEW